ncbi:hypothetical protein AWB85_21785 [Mycobacteroides immunogenum]|uniref:Uncharacterized protein n=2 Tax=Mycobacteroides TaxID=670516 RepID=A0A179VGJ7_9MYCO|nr:hypothetical protein [Mycobacteroides immunogenum]OAT69396.1 hypothetical protein AWB85_21785 [Mycobacteroides immunogenum]
MTQPVHNTTHAGAAESDGWLLISPMGYPSEWRQQDPTNPFTEESIWQWFVPDRPEEPGEPLRQQMKAEGWVVRRAPHTALFTTFAVPTLIVRASA